MYTTVSILVTRLPELENRDAWRLFEQRYTPLLKRYFRKSSCAEDIANDLAQETIQRVAKGLRDGAFHREDGRLRDWIGGISRNVLRNHRRKAKYRANIGQPKTRFWTVQEDPAAEEALQAADERFDAIWVRTRLSKLIRLATETFSTRDLRCYFLVEIQKLPIKEVAHRTGFSETSVYQKRRKVANWFLTFGPRFISKWEQ